MKQTTKEPFVVHCGNCSHEWTAAYLPMPIDRVMPLMKTPCPMCGAKQVLIGPLPKPTVEGDAQAWLANGDTGISSTTIWRVLTGSTEPTLASWDNDEPNDPDDFGRCYRLLKVMPSWRARLPEVAVKFPAWKPLVDAWDELTALYEKELPKGRWPKLYQRMQKLRGQEVC